MKLQRLSKLICIVFFVPLLYSQVQQFSKITEFNKSRSGNQLIDGNNELRAIFRLHEATYSGNRETKARAFLRDKVQQFRGKVADDKSTLILEKILEHPAASHLRFQQHYNGIPVYHSQIVVSFNKDETITMLTSDYRSSIRLSKETAGFNGTKAIQIASGYLPDISGLMAQPQSRLMILDNDDDDRLVYKVNIVISNSTVIGDFEFLIDATSGEILQVMDLQKNYYHGDPKTKKKVSDGMGYVFNPNPLSEGKAIYGSPGFSDNEDADTDSLTKYRSLVVLKDLTESAGLFSLKNQYVTIINIETPDTVVYPQLADPNNFLYTRSQQNFEAVNVFYHIDKTRRYLDSLGFTDINPSNANAGDGLRSMKADPHGFQGTDNSHFFPSIDAISWGEGGVDDAEDADVILHEFGHAIQDWTVPGFAGNEGLGEGFADYWANSYYRSATNWTSIDAQYSYVFAWDGHNEFWSGRTTQFIGHYPESKTGSIHHDGQLWSTPLMRIYDRVGRLVTDQLVIKSHYYLNASAGQVANAEAVLQADFDLFDGSHATIIREEFTSYGQMTIAYPAPSDLVSENYLDGHVNLRWQLTVLAAPDAWSIERADVYDGPYTEIYNGPTDSLYFSDASVENEKTYYYQLRAIYNSNPSNYSNRVIGIASSFGPPVKISDVLVDEDALPTIIDLDEIFGDSVTYNVSANSNTGLLTVTLDSSVLSLNYVADQNGSASIEMEINYPDTTRLDTFIVTVQPIDDPPRIIDSIPDITRNNPPLENDTIVLVGRYVDIDSDLLEYSVEESSSKLIAQIVGTNLILKYPIAAQSNIPVSLTVTADGKMIVDNFLVKLRDTKPPTAQVYTALASDFDRSGKFTIKMVFSEALTDKPVLKLKTALTDTNYLMNLNTETGFYESLIVPVQSGIYSFTAFFSDVYANQDSIRFEKNIYLINPSKNSSFDLTDSITMSVQTGKFNQQLWLNVNPVTNATVNGLEQISRAYNITSTADLEAGEFFTITMKVPLNSKSDQRKIGLYQYQKSTDSWSYIGGEAADGLVSGDFESFGTIALFYNDNHQYLADHLQLLQNYPNPFNPTTTIQVKLDRRSHVVIDIFNVLGQQVKRLVDRELPRNNYNFNWNGTNTHNQQVPSGVYFYRIYTVQAIISKKMILIR
ncbi:MAG: T9SS type A sorting domain-containing protein [Calditrichaeota bacterium]|nr:T9SS type A sorting domain-containing protein [Calditrichota bacterium]